MRIEKIIATIFEITIISNEVTSFIKQIENTKGILKCKSILLNETKAVLVITVDPNIKNREKFIDKIYDIGLVNYNHTLS